MGHAQHDNVEIVRAVYEHFAATHTVDLSKLSPRVVWDMTHFETWPERQVYEGHDGVDEFIRRWLEPWQTYEHELERLEAIGGKVVAIVRVSGTAGVSGARVAMRVGHAWTLTDGVVVRVDLYSDAAKALDAAK